MNRLAKISLLLLALVAWLPSAHACSACFGKSDSNLAAGMNAGIFALLAVVVGVLGGVAGFFVYLARRAALHPANSLPVGVPAPANEVMEKV